MSLFYPTAFEPRITAVTAQELQKMGIRGLLLDVDNTLTTHGSQEVDPAVLQWLQEMRGAGLSLTIVSNAKRRRVEPFAARLGLESIAMACKPLPIGFWRAANQLGLSRRECLVIGDQTFTDIVGARLGGMRCIQLDPILLEEGWTFRLKRWLERKLRRRYERRAARRGKRTEEQPE